MSGDFERSGHIHWERFVGKPVGRTLLRSRKSIAEHFFGGWHEFLPTENQGMIARSNDRWGTMLSPRDGRLAESPAPGVEMARGPASRAPLFARVRHRGE